MGKKTVFTNITPLPPNVTREVAVAMLHNHAEMIELNPLVIEHHPVKTPRDAPKDEFLDCAWYEMTDRISYLPGGMVKGKVTYKGCFHNLPNGLQTHVYAPMSLDIREKWTVCGTLPGEPEEPRELGLNTPRRGLYLREDGEMRCNMLMTSFVRKNLDNSHKVLVERILGKAERVQAQVNYSASEASSMRSPSNTNIPPFQPGSHMGNSKLARQMSGTPTAPTPTSSFRPDQRIPAESPAVQAARSQLSNRDHHNTIQELPVTQPGNKEGSIQPQTLTERDPEELRTVHPALREQYRQNMTPTAGKSFAVELEGSRPETSSSAKYSASTTSRHAPEPVELDGGYSIPTKSDADRRRNTDKVNSRSRDRSASGKSTSTNNERQGRTMQPSLSHMRSYSQPMIEANSYIDSASSAHNMIPDSSMISTHPAVNRGNDESVMMGQGRFRALSNSGTWPQIGPDVPYINDNTQTINMPSHTTNHNQGYYISNNTHPNPKNTYNQKTHSNQSNSYNHNVTTDYDPNDPSRYSMVSEISDMPTPKADQFAFGTGQVDSRYSVVSAMTDGAPTPRMNNGSFADHQRQHLEREREMQRRNFI